MTSDQAQNLLDLTQSLYTQAQAQQNAMILLNTQIAVLHEALMVLVFLLLFLSIVVPLLLAYGRKSANSGGSA